MAWEVILVASITSEPTWSELTDRVGLAVVRAGRDNLKQVGEREAVVLLPDADVELWPLSTNLRRWDARVISDIERGVGHGNRASGESKQSKSVHVDNVERKYDRRR